MGKRVKLTEAEALQLFFTTYRLTEKTARVAGRIDRVALCESWNNYVDRLCKDGLVTEKQADTWTNPFYKEVTA